MAEPNEPPTPKDFEPFAEDASVRTIGGLSIENGTDQIAIHGSLDLTRDGAGLERARALAEALADIVKALEEQALPERISETRRQPRSVKNPFA